MHSCIIVVYTVIGVSQGLRLYNLQFISLCSYCITHFDGRFNFLSGTYKSSWPYHQATVVDCSPAPSHPTARPLSQHLQLPPAQSQLSSSARPVCVAYLPGDPSYPARIGRKVCPLLLSPRGGRHFQIIPVLPGPPANRGCFYRYNLVELESTNKETSPWIKN